MPTLPAAFADLEPFADWALPSEADRYAKRIASTMDELQAFYDAAFPRLEDSTDYLKGVALDGHLRRGPQPAVALRVAGHRVLPRRGLAPAPGAGQRRLLHRRDRGARPLGHVDRFGGTMATYVWSTAAGTGAGATSGWPDGCGPRATRSTPRA